jgi:glycerol-3-phosphate dehydrogenase
MSYSRPTRTKLQPDDFDVAIIGGGINGVAIARECALAGRRVLLVEKADFASGTTSRSTRIIHGGLRYLEHAEIGLVRESLREREALLKQRPHLVRPLEFVLALPTHGFKRSSLAIRTGLWAYGLYGKPAKSQDTKKDIATFEAMLDRDLNLSLFSYEDAQCEYPERLVAEWLTEAIQAGAVVRNYTDALEITVQEGKARGIRIRDQITGEEAEATADWVLNATGPWADDVLGNSQLAKQPLITRVRGSHIVLPQFDGAPESALYTEAIDKRPMFVIPWAGQLLIGTTEVLQQESQDGVQPTSEEITYLLATVNRLFPRARITASDIRYSYAGVRPLPYTPRASLGEISRRHRLHDHVEDGVAGLITVVGGKLTTAASLARSCARMMGIRVPEPQAKLVAVDPAVALSSTLTQWASGLGKIAGISMESATAVAEWHGRRGLCVARLAFSDPVLQQTLCPHSDHIVAEAVEAVQHEAAITLADVLLRRVPVALGACWNDDCSRIAADRIGAALGWTEREQRTELESFREERQRFLRPAVVPPRSGDSLKESLLFERAD